MRRSFLEAVGMTRFGKRDEGLLELCSEAVDALSRSGGDLGEVEALFLGTMNPEEYLSRGNLATALTDRLGLSGIPAVRVETASSSGAAVFHEAARAVRCGDCAKVLCVAAEKMTHVDTRRSTGILAEVISPIERCHGATMPALAALITRRYMHEHGMTREALARVPVKSHANGAKNPYAHFQKRVEVDQVLSSRMVSDPLTLLDCAPMSDGACCATVTSRSSQVELLGTGQATDTLAICERESITSSLATRLAAQKAYRMAGIGPGSVQLAEVHDAFSSFELIGCEDLGLFPVGESWRAVERGETELDGRLPVNTSGGLKARGHPVGASGLAQIVEVFLQISGDAGPRQVDASLGLAHSLGGLANNNFVTILGAAR